ncbi:MAG TPA: Asp-tRNA(Asn)/Glu-tRNA(Gln) amidotransferase subunit GatC [Vicinamibacteria bacterium]
MARATVDTIDHVARLARLSLSEGERQTFARQLDEILVYAESIQGLDTDGVEPMSHAAAAELFREDTPRPGLPRPTAVEAAPDTAEGLFRVPRILGG